jgi:hypothetical protein
VVEEKKKEKDARDLSFYTQEKEELKRLKNEVCVYCMYSVCV